MVAAAVAFAAGVALGVAMLRSIETGETWYDWQAAVSPRWVHIVGYGVLALLPAGLLVRGVVGASLVAVPFGVCSVFFTVGIRRRWQARHLPRPEEPHDEEPFEEPRASWRSKVLELMAWLLIVGVILYVVGLRGLELVAASLGLVLLLFGIEKLNDRVVDRFDTWIRR